MIRNSRFELKYVIEEPRAVAIADFVRSYLQPSIHNGNGPIRGHPVISLYLDSADWLLFRQSYTGHKNRMKLRIRFYDDEWERPATLEIKRRVGEVVCKDRALISREGVRQILSGAVPGQPFWGDPGALLKSKRRPDVSSDFWRFANTVGARGAIYVSYYREVYESAEDEELRVTLDRSVHGSSYDGSGRLQVPARGWRPYLPPYMAPFPKDAVILELKFNNQAPRWMAEMARLFNLKQLPVCKYSACVYAQQLQWHRAVLPELEETLIL